MRQLVRSWRFWGWFAFLFAAFATFNLVGFSIKGTRIYGFPYTFVAWSQYGQESPRQWWFQWDKLVLNVIIGLLGAALVAGGCVWGVRNR
jgi:hypothetical protein